MHELAITEDILTAALDAARRGGARAIPGLGPVGCPALPIEPGALRRHCPPSEASRSSVELLPAETRVAAFVRVRPPRYRHGCGRSIVRIILNLAVAFTACGAVAGRRRG